MQLLRTFLILFCFFISTIVAAQNPDGLVARFYFNEGIAQNDLTSLPVKASGIAFGTDRFGNSSSTCYLNGNINSYLNLGTGDILKPVTGSISLWIKIGIPIHAGRGYKVNPIIVTKCCVGDDFYEAYSISYILDSKKLGVACTLDSITQINASTPEIFPLDEWHQVVLTYDNNELAFYIDAKLLIRVNKQFQLQFLAGDSVMVGNSANVKNSRYFNGDVDDISIYNKVLSQDEITALFNEPDPNRFRTAFKWVIKIVLVIICIGLIIMLFVRRLKQKLEKEKEKNVLQSQLYDMEMKVIKAQMNPHFIFNSMNSIQQFILSENTESANTYLVKFSRLLRKILESNTEEFITIENEIDILNKYIEMEALRFSQAFMYEIISDEQLIVSQTRIPQMLIQPFVENAIWHGLLPKKGNKTLTIKFEYVNEKLLSCLIEDNGIGYNPVQVKDTLTKSKSLGILFIKQRLELMKRMRGGDYSLTITNKTDANGNPCGTLISIRMPIYN